MASVQFHCSQCHMVLDDSAIESHISAQHLYYFPLECAWCKETNHSHFSTTKEEMKDHCSKNHTGNNSRYSAVEDEGKEVELKKLAKACRDLPIRQISSNHLECALPRVDGTSPTSNGNGADQDEADIIALRDNNETAAMPNDSLGYNLSEKPKEEIRPTAIAETGQIVVDPVINPENDTPIDVDANEDQRKKRSHSADSSGNSMGSSRKRRVPLRQHSEPHGPDASTQYATFNVGDVVIVGSEIGGWPGKILEIYDDHVICKLFPLTKKIKPCHVLWENVQWFPVEEMDDYMEDTRNNELYIAFGDVKRYLERCGSVQATEFKDRRRRSMRLATGQ